MADQTNETLDATSVDQLDSDGFLSDAVVTKKGTRRKRAKRNTELTMVPVPGGLWRAHPKGGGTLPRNVGGMWVDKGELERRIKAHNESRK